MAGDDDRVDLSPVAFVGASAGDAQLPTQARVFGAPTRGDGGETSQRRRMAHRNRHTTTERSRGPRPTPRAHTSSASSDPESAGAHDFRPARPRVGWGPQTPPRPTPSRAGPELRLARLPVGRAHKPRFARPRVGRLRREDFPLARRTGIYDE
ncbi:hypothetical protein EJB05_57274, partial [Eragrostis curvula]